MLHNNNLNNLNNRLWALTVLVWLRVMVMVMGEAVEAVEAVHCVRGSYHVTGPEIGFNPGPTTAPWFLVAGFEDTSVGSGCPVLHPRIVMRTRDHLNQLNNLTIITSGRHYIQVHIRQTGQVLVSNTTADRVQVLHSFPDTQDFQVVWVAAAGARAKVWLNGVVIQALALHGDQTSRTRTATRTLAAAAATNNGRVGSQPRTEVEVEVDGTMEAGAGGQTSGFLGSIGSRIMSVFGSSGKPTRGPAPTPTPKWRSSAMVTTNVTIPNQLMWVFEAVTRPGRAMPSFSDYYGSTADYDKVNLVLVSV